MVGIARKKRVTDPLDDEAKARLVGADLRRLSYGSSGSEHSGDGGGNSLCLSELINDFLEGYAGESDPETREFDTDRVDPEGDESNLIADTILRLDAANNVDPYRRLLVENISEAAAKFEYLRRNVSVFRRNVMAFLREKGNNAAICKTRWDNSGGITAGNYEFIDVIGSDNRRYFVDVEFSGQFEIARPTRNYSGIASSLPMIFVGTEEELKRIVPAMCDAGKRCFRCRGLSVPPWRKNRYMQNKWFGPYRRTVNPVRGNVGPDVVTAVAGVSCRLVGFEDVSSEVVRHGGVFVRTR